MEVTCRGCGHDSSAPGAIKGKIDKWKLYRNTAGRFCHLALIRRLKYVASQRNMASSILRERFIKHLNYRLGRNTSFLQPQQIDAYEQCLVLLDIIMRVGKEDAYSNGLKATLAHSSPPSPACDESLGSSAASGGSGGEFSCVRALRVARPAAAYADGIVSGITFLSLRLFLRVSRSPMSVCRYSESPAGGTGSRGRGGAVCGCLR